MLEGMRFYDQVIRFYICSVVVACILATLLFSFLYLCFIYIQLNC